MLLKTNGRFLRINNFAALPLIFCAFATAAFLSGCGSSGNATHAFVAAPPLLLPGHDVHAA